jgi:hypothetical protein
MIIVYLDKVHNHNNETKKYDHRQQVAYASSWQQLPAAAMLLQQKIKCQKCINNHQVL